MRTIAAGDTCGSRHIGSSSSTAATPQPWLHATGACCSRVRQPQALPLHQQLPRDPPSAYHVLRQQLQQADDSNTGRQRQQQQQQQHWPRPTDEVHKAISKRLKQAGSADAVLQVVWHHEQQFNAVNTALAYAQLARHLRFETAAARSAVLQHSCYAALQGLAQQQAGQLNTRQVCMLLTSLAWMQCPAAEAHGSTDSTTASHVAAGETAAEQTNANASCSSSGSGASPATDHTQQQQALLLQRLSQRLQVLLDAFEPEDTCHCLWALCKLGALQPELLAAATQHSLAAGWLHMLTSKPLSSLLWVHAQLHSRQPQQQQQQGANGANSLFVHHKQQQQQQQQQQVALVPQLIAAVTSNVSQPGFLATWTPQELSMLLWSCAVLGVPLQQQQQQPLLQAQALHGMQRAQQQAASSSSGPLEAAASPTSAAPTSAASAAVAAMLPLSVLQEVVQLATRHVLQFTPQGVAMVCWSLAQLLTGGNSGDGSSSGSSSGGGSSSPLLPSLQQAVVQLFDSFTAAAASRLQYYSPQEVCNVFSACSRLQLLPAGGFHQAAESYISSHVHKLGSRDVTDLLLAAVQLPQQQQEGRLGLPLVQQQQQRVWLRRKGLHLGPVAVRALLHRVKQLGPELNGFQLAAAAWACVRLGEQQQQQQQQLQQAGAAAEAHRGSRSSSSSGSSSLQEECLGVASLLLGTLELQVSAAPRPGTPSHAGAAPAAGDEAAAAPASGDVKQAVGVAWALAAVSMQPGHRVPAAAQQGQQHQHQHQHQHQQGYPVLLSSVLNQLQASMGSCHGPALVQSLCVLLRLLPALSNTVGSSREQQHGQQQSPAAAAAQVQELWHIAVSRLPPLLQQLTAAQAATAAWAIVKLRCQLSSVELPSTSQPLQANSAQPVSGSPQDAAVSVLSAMLLQLQQRQQVAQLSAQDVCSLLWCCKATGWSPPAPVYTSLLQAADAKLLQMQVQQQVALLTAVAQMPSAAATAQDSLRPTTEAQQHHLSQLQQLQKARARLLHGLVEQLQLQLYQQAQQLEDAVSRRPAAAAAAARQESQASGLQPAELIAVVAACKSLAQQPQPQQQQLLQQVLEVWRLLLQQGRPVVSPHSAMRMVWHLADVLPDSPCQPWHAAVLQQQLPRPSNKQQQQQCPVGPELLLPQLLSQALASVVRSLAAAASAAGTPDQQQQQHHQQQQQQQASLSLAPQTLVLALRVCAKLTYQPPPQLLVPLLQQLQATLPGLSEADITAALMATAQVGFSSQQLTAAAVQELHCRQAPGRVGADMAAGEGQPAQERSKWQSRPSSQSLLFLWAALTGGAGSAAAAAAAVGSQAATQLLVKLAHEAADASQQQLFTRPELLLASQEVWRMLRRLPQYQRLRRTLHYCGLPLPKALLLPQQLLALTQVLLPSDRLAGQERQRRLLQLLFASPQQQTAMLQQSMLSNQQAHRPPTLVQQQQQLWSELLPLWLQHQLQRHCQVQVASRVLTAQAAAGLAAAKVSLRLMPSGEVVLLLEPESHSMQRQHRQQGEGLGRPQQGQQGLQQEMGSSQGDCATPAATVAAVSAGAADDSQSADAGCGSSSPSLKGLAVVLETPRSVSVNTGRLLGPSLARNAVLSAEGFSVLSLSLQAWLPGFVLQYQQELLQQQYEGQPGRQQYIQQLGLRRLHKLDVERKLQLQQVLEALHGCRQQ